MRSTSTSAHIVADGAPGALAPRARYEADIERPDFDRDWAQDAVVAALQDTYNRLVATQSHGIRHLLSKTRHSPVHGLYIWGGVGRGKTYLMDCFYDALPFENKRRLHFHRFMQKVHEASRHHQHQSDPLRVIAKEWAADRVLCLDEFFVSDVADAMILSRLTEELFERGVTLVTTSNVKPDTLYRGGLQREHFIPAIERIKTHCRVIHLDDGTDYRLGHIDNGATYQTPDGPEADAVLAQHFDKLATGGDVHGDSIETLGRTIPVRRRAQSVVWFDFASLCRSKRSPSDYIALAREFPSIMVSGVPVFDDSTNNAAKRFVNAVDVFYDRHVNLFCTAAAEPDDLYAGTRLAFEFKRTASRLHDMSSQEYIGAAHRS